MTYVAFESPTLPATYRAITALLTAHAFSRPSIQATDPAARNPHRLPIDPNTLFDAVEFDPRLKTFERLERQVAARGLGYESAFSDSRLYQGAAMEIILGAH